MLRVLRSFEAQQAKHELSRLNLRRGIDPGWLDRPGSIPPPKLSRVNTSRRLSKPSPFQS